MQSEKLNNLIYKLSIFFLVVGSIYFFSKTSYEYYNLIISPYQQEYRETVTSFATQLLMDNENPYRIENQPEYAQAYGITQNIIAYPFAYLFGSSLQIHRIVTLIGIILSCLTVILWLIRLKTPLIIAISATLTLYLSFFYNVLPINRPDSWGLFFMLLSIYLPCRYNYSSKSLLASIILGLTAFYTKSYFVLGIVSVGSFIFFFVSKKKGLIYTLIFFISFAISIYIVSSIYPLFFYLTILSFLNYSIEGSWVFANKQILTYFYINKFLLVLGCISLFSFFYLLLKNKSNLNYKISINIFDFNKALISIKFISQSNLLIIYTFFLLLITVYLILGKNDGAFLIYYFTHSTPFLILVVLILLFKNKNKLVVSVGIILILLNIWSVDRLLYSSSLSKEQQKNWKKTQNYIQNSSHVIGSAAVANLIKERGLKVYEQGLSGQFILTGNVKNPILKSLFPRYKEIGAKSKQFYAQIDSNITNQNFDLIITEKNKDAIYTNKDISNYYTKIDTLTLAMPFTGQYWQVEFWKPKK